MLNEKTRDKIIDDLMRARPLGPDHPYKKITYEKRRNGDRYCRKSYAYVDTFELIPSDPLWGYTDETIFDLGIHEEDDAQKYVLDRWFEGKTKWNLGKRKSTVTRRTNRLWERVHESVRKVKKAGGTGIYKVHANYRESFGYLYAANMEEAKTASDLYFGYLIPESERRYNSYPRVEFIRHGTAIDVTALNVQGAAAIQKSVTEARKAIAEKEAHIEMLNARLSALAIVEEQQLAVELGE